MTKKLIFFQLASQINFTLQDSEIAEDIKCMNNFFPADPNFGKFLLELKTLPLLMSTK